MDFAFNPDDLVLRDRAVRQAAGWTALCLWSVAWADVPDAQRAEVTHLFTYVEQAACPVERNGKAYSPADAVAHIRKKYAHFRDQIKSTEDFIELAASRSEVSKKSYRVACQGKAAVDAKQFMLEELARYRAKGR